MQQRKLDMLKLNYNYALWSLSNDYKGCDYLFQLSLYKLNTLKT